MSALRKRPFPALRTEVSELALGTWGLSGEAYGTVSSAQADAVIGRALDLGINLYETADCYAEGGMERKLGERLQAHKSQTFVVTKLGTDRSIVPARKNFTTSYLRQAFQRSCDRLGRDRIDVCLLHNPNVVTVERGEAIEVLKGLSEQGCLGAWGVSAGNQDVALAAIEAGANVVELPYNLFQSRDLHAIAGEIAMRGVSVLARSVLAHGLLAATWGPRHSFAEGDHRNERWSTEDLDRRIQQLSVVRQMVGKDVLTPRAAAVRFVLSNSLVTSAVLGPRNGAQLEQLVREAGHGPPYLPDALLASLPSQLLAAGIHT